MASKKTPSKSKPAAAKPAASKAAPKATSTPVRHTPIPKVEAFAAPASRMAITSDMIANRAFEIWSNQGGSDVDNWLKAESELRAA